MAIENSKVQTARLSLEAAQAVRAYVFKLIIPAGAVLAVVSFLLGFFIQKVAQNEAAKDAFNSVQDVIFQSIRNIATAESTAQEVSNKLAKLQSEALSISEKLRTTDAFSKSEVLVSQVADAIATRQDFLSKVTPLPGQIEFIRAQLDSLLSNLRTPHHNELPSTGGNVKSMSCPQGAYMVGVRMQSDSGGPHGIVSTVIPVCRTILPP